MELPIFHVVRGRPSDDEVAAAVIALVAVIAASDGAGAPAPQQRPGWRSTGEFPAPGAWTSR